MSERIEIHPVNVAETIIPDPNKIADYQSPYPDRDLMARTISDEG